MSGIFGWVGAIASPETSGSILEGMAAASDANTGSPATLREGLFHAGTDAPRAESSMLLHADAELGVCLSDPVTLARRDGTGRESADAAQLAAAYRQDPGGLVSRLRGRFALAIADLRSRCLLLAVDRVGVRSLYVRRHGDAICFASRLQALAELPGPTPTLSDQALFDYLYLQMVPSPGSIYAGVHKLLPAQELRIPFAGGAGREQARFYWEMPYVERNADGLDGLTRQFRDLLPQVVSTAAAGTEASRVGCFLSGGTDSSTVAGTWRALAGQPTPSYSIGFAAEGFDEMAYARMAARHFDTDPREYYVTPADVVDSIRRVAAFCDEPFGNASVVPAYLCARNARNDGIERLLAGDGGDEIFGGNERYYTQALFERYGRVPAPLRTLLQTLVGLPGAQRVAPIRKAASYIAQARVPLPDRFQTYNFLHRTALTEIFEPDFLARVDTEGPLENLREVYHRTRGAATVNRMMHLDLKITLADNDLRKVNQACALAGMDVRYPLLDERMLAFAATVPPRMQLRGTHLRWFFKRALADFLPAEIIAKRKQGFGLPVGLWMAEYPPLAELTQDSIDALRQRGIVAPAYLDWVCAQHRESHASYYGVMLWLLVMLEQWLQARNL